MIDLISQARRHAPSEDKANIKLVNPNILDELSKLYHNSEDTVFKAIITDTFALAGDPWPAKLREKEVAKQSGKKYVTRVYRGQVQRVETSNNDSTMAANKPKRIYRGQVVA